MNLNFKNPTIYYILSPILAGAWAVLAGFVFYPGSIEAWETGKSDYAAVEKQIAGLVALQPERLAYKMDKDAKPEDFDFSKTINEAAAIFAISPSNYNLSVKGEVKSAGRKARSATISIKTIEVQNFAGFLSTMLYRWPDLKCENLGITKLKDSKNKWKIDVKLTYYY